MTAFVSSIVIMCGIQAQNGILGARKGTCEINYVMVTSCNLCAQLVTDYHKLEVAVKNY